MEALTSLFTSIFGEDFDFTAIINKIIEYVKTIIASLTGGTATEE